MRAFSLSLALLALTLPACARSQTAAADGEREQQRPLSSLAAQRLVVLPVQYLREADSLGWASAAGSPREYLRTVDSEITFAVKGRGVESMWVFAEQIARSAKRNSGYAADPYALAAQSLRPGVKRKQELLREPLATQLRSLVAFTEARYALLPVELRFERGGGSDGAVGRAVLHLVLVDARRSRPVWAIEVASDPAQRFSPALAASVAEHLADLVAEPN
ncbi:MAG TPA: hypothetical protein VJ672_04065 [Gemmatimonadaceae bacterium]|nr:hypothetical protein [Gemmatimonadaceae bacterium]